MQWKWQLDCPVGKLTLLESDGRLSGIYPATHFDLPDIAPLETPLFAETQRQLAEYFAGTRKVFSLPLLLEGTPFQKRVWSALQEIPWGSTCSYRELAAAAGSGRAYRAAGNANGKNPLMIVVPCHRVIGADGSLGGYSGGLDIKRKLLILENPESPFAVRP